MIDLFFCVSVQRNLVPLSADWNRVWQPLPDFRAKLAAHVTWYQLPLKTERKQWLLALFKWQLRDAGRRRRVRVLLRFDQCLQHSPFESETDTAAGAWITWDAKAPECSVQWGPAGWFEAAQDMERALEISSKAQIGKRFVIKDLWLGAKSRQYSSSQQRFGRLRFRWSWLTWRWRGRLLQSATVAPLDLTKGQWSAHKVWGRLFQRDLTILIRSYSWLLEGSEFYARPGAVALSRLFVECLLCKGRNKQRYKGWLKGS